MGGHVGARGVGDLTEVTEGEGGDEAAVVVDVEGSPATVSALHAERPGHGPLVGGVPARRAGFLEARPVEGQDDLGGVVDVGVVVVGELECPSAGSQTGAAHGPVT